MTNPPEQGQDAPQPLAEQPGAQPAEPVRPTRQSIIARQAELRRRTRPFFIGGIVVFLLILTIPTYAFVQKYVLPPRELALRVEDVEYTRGDLVSFIRFHQRLSEERGQQFQIGNSLFDALQTMADNEIAFQVAPLMGVTVEPAQVDRFIRVALGFVPLSDEAAALPQNRAQIAEKFRQFLNGVGLTEVQYRDIVRKELFREKVREEVGLSVSRIQEQVRVYEIRLASEDKPLLATLRRRLKAGDAIGDLAVRHSVDVNVRRTNGDLGWLPRKVRPEYDSIFFGTREDGSRILPVGELTELTYDSQSRQWLTFIVTETASAREISDAHLESLKDRAFADFVGAERRRLDVYLVLNDRIYNWVNQQVRIASILPTPTAVSPFAGFQ